MTPKLSILTPAIWRRIDKTRALADLIAPHPQAEHVVVLDNMTRSVGLKRQACMDAAIGDYVMFCDDDDEIFPETIPLILAAIKHSPDVITFKQDALYNGKRSEVVFHLNNQDGPFVEGGQTLRAPWHVCAWKRELVTDCLFPDINYGEDRVWAEQARRRVRNGLHIDQVLHRYTHDARETAAPESENLNPNSKMMNTTIRPTELPDTSGSGLAEIVASYHAAVKALHEYRIARYKSGQFVRVNDARFKGIGMVCAYSSEIPPHKLPVRLENNNVWWYDLESIVEIVPAKDVPRSVRRMKLRWHGYKLGAAA